MKVYVLISESGSYSDFGYWIEGVFDSWEAAKSHVPDSGHWENDINWNADTKKQVTDLARLVFGGWIIQEFTVNPPSPEAPSTPS